MLGFSVREPRTADPHTTQRLTEFAPAVDATKMMPAVSSMRKADYWTSAYTLVTDFGIAPLGLGSDDMNMSPS
jgi:hypothetical protein